MPLRLIGTAFGVTSLVMIIPPQITHLIRPDALHSGKSAHTASHFHILMCSVHLLQALADVRHHPAQHLAAHDHTRASHAEVLARLQCQLAQLITSPHPCLTQENSLAAVQASQEALQAFAFDIDIIIGTHEPLEPVQVVVVHVLEHHEGFLLRRVGVIHVF